MDFPRRWIRWRGEVGARFQGVRSGLGTSRSWYHLSFRRNERTAGVQRVFWAREREYISSGLISETRRHFSSGGGIRKMLGEEGSKLRLRHRRDPIYGTRDAQLETTLQPGRCVEGRGKRVESPLGVERTEPASLTKAGEKRRGTTSEVVEGTESPGIPKTRQRGATEAMEAEEERREG